MNIVYIIFAAIKVQIAVTVHIACIANTVRPCNSYGGKGSIHIDFTVTEGYVYAWEGFSDTGRIIIHFPVSQPGDIAQFAGPVIEVTAAAGIGSFQKNHVHAAKALGTCQDGPDVRAGMGGVFCQEPEFGGDEIEGVPMVKLYFPAPDRRINRGSSDDGCTQ